MRTRRGWNEDDLPGNAHVAPLSPAQADAFWRAALAATLPLALAGYCVAPHCGQAARGAGWTCGRAECVAVWADWPPHIAAELGERVRIEQVPALRLPAWTLVALAAIAGAGAGVLEIAAVLAGLYAGRWL